MSVRKSFLLAGLGIGVLASSSALAGGAGCATCYRQVMTPPVYGTVANTVMVRAPRTVAHTVPGEYGMVAEKVMVSPPRKTWQVRRDVYGHAIGCWVMTPARYAVQHRHVTMRAPQVVHETLPPAYATYHRQVLVRPASAEWQPIGYSGGRYLPAPSRWTRYDRGLSHHGAEFVGDVALGAVGGFAFGGVPGAAFGAAGAAIGL